VRTRATIGEAGATADDRRRVLDQLRRDADMLARDFELPLRHVMPEGPRVTSRYGVCYEDGEIRIRLTHVRSGKLLKYSALVDTLCHELAHLRHFNHGRRFQALYRRILTRARRLGIYCPGIPVPAPAPAPVPRPRRRPAVLTKTKAPRPAPLQLELFAKSAERSPRA
jgi:hypothetical protein